MIANRDDAIQQLQDLLHDRDKAEQMLGYIDGVVVKALIAQKQHTRQFVRSQFWTIWTVGFACGVGTAAMAAMFGYMAQ